MTRAHFDRFVNKPYYLWRPSQVLRRRSIGAMYANAQGQTTMVPTLWGTDIECFTGETIGSSIARTGVYDLSVTEAIFRLGSSGGLVVDAGANVGWMSLALAVATGPRGQVLAFEPHPDVVAVLRSNCRRWAVVPHLAPIEVHAVALSSVAGKGILETTSAFRANRGTAHVAGHETSSRGNQRLNIQLKRLSDVAHGRRIALLKVDVEGHELELLRGAEAMLGDGLVSNLLIEDQSGYPSAVSAHLERLGFTLYGLSQRLRGPALTEPGRARNRWDPPTLLGTLNPEETASRFQRSGWLALRGGSSDR